MEYRRLGQTDMEVSVLSFGASSLGGVFREVNERDCVETVEVVIEGGINLIDVSPAYGETLAEKNLGKALKGIPRDQYYLATKVGSYSERLGDYDYSEQRTRESVAQSLERLGVDQVDLIQCHDIEFADHHQIVEETIPTLQSLKEEGLVRYIGLTGLPLKIFPSIIDRVPAGTIDTVLSFCHYALNDTSLETLIPYLQSHGVGIINASPTGMGLLTDRGAPDWHPASEEIKAACRKAAEHCRKAGVDIVELAVAFACSHPAIATTLVGTANPENMRRNIAWAENPCDWTRVEEVREILKPVMNFNYTRGLPEHRDPIKSSETTN